MKRTHRFVCGCASGLLVVFVSSFVTWFGGADGQMLNDYPLIFRPEMKRSVSGTNIFLKCAVLYPCPNNVVFKWEFQACGPNLYRSKCHTDLRDWRRISVNATTKNCVFDLWLQRVTQKNSGLYRCLYSDDNYGEFREIKTYEVDIIEKIRYDEGSPPQLLEVFPVSTTVTQNNKVAIQCKIFSRIPPTILWFKQLDHPILNVSLEYNNKTYVKLSSGPQIKLDDDVYLSKLIIESSSAKDAGSYKCLALNNFGKVDKDARVDVITPAVEWEETTSFSVLFLIPLALAMIPITVWLCYYRKHLKYKLINKNLLDNTVSNGHTV